MPKTRLPIITPYKKGYTRQLIGYKDTSPPTLEELRTIKHVIELGADDANEFLFTLEELVNDTLRDKRPLREPRMPCPGLITSTQQPKKVRIVIDLTVHTEIIDLTK